MATTVKIRRSGTATATPSSLEHGEIAINYADGKVFWKDASNVITSFTFQSYALASHTHAASDITSGTLDSARLPLATTGAAGAMIVGTGLGVSSGTVSVTYGTSSGTACEGNDARLSDTRTPTDGSVTTAKIENDAVTYAKLQNVSTTDRLLGRSSAGAGDVEEITCTAFGRSLIDDADAATARTTLGVQPTASPAFTGSMSLINSGASDNSTIRYGNSGQDWYVGLRGDTSNAFAIADSVAFRLTISSAGTATFAGQVLVTAGSGSSGSYKPGLAISGDDDTGVQQVGGANTLSIVTGGTERVRVDASGNVGIGRDSPNTKLEVAESIGVYGSQPIVAFRVSSNTLRFTLFAFDADALHVGRYDASGNYVDSPLQISRTSGNIVTPAVYSATVGGTNRDVYVDNGGLLGYVSSIRESKTDIVTLDDVSWLSALSPVSYRYRKRNADGNYTDEADGVTDYGLIAEDVEAVKPELCFYDDVDGEPQLRGVTYSKLITPMLRYIQQLEARIAALEERLNHG